MNKIVVYPWRRRVKHFVQRITGLTVFRGVPRGVSLAHDIKVMGIAADIVFDIGANVGKSAIDYAGFWPESKVYSFEPVQSTYEELLANTAGLKNVMCHHLAFGDTPGMARMNIHSGSDRVRSLFACPLPQKNPVFFHYSNAYSANEGH